MFYMLAIGTRLMTSSMSGPSGEDFPKADIHARDVWEEEGQPEEASSQTDQACAASSPQAWGLHQIPSQLTWSVSTQTHMDCLFIVRVFSAFFRGFNASLFAFPHCSDTIISLYGYYL